MFAFIFVGHLVIFPPVFSKNTVLCVDMPSPAALFVRHWCSVHLCLVSIFPCIISRYFLCLLSVFYPILLCRILCFSSNLCPFHDVFPFLLSLLSNAQRARTVCIMYCIQPRKHMMNSRQSRAVFISEQSLWKREMRHWLTSSSMAAGLGIGAYVLTF